MEYELARSRRLALLLFAAHGIACALLWASLPILALSIAGSLLLALSLSRSLRQHCGEGRIDRLRATREGQLRLLLANEWRDVEVLGSTFVAPYLTVINLRLSERRGTVSVVILPDSLTVEDFRRLRVWLKWKCEAKA